MRLDHSGHIHAVDDREEIIVSGAKTAYVKAAQVKDKTNDTESQSKGNYT